MSMFIENLQLISVNNTIQPEDLKRTDEVEIEYSVTASTKGQLFRVLQYTCFAMIKETRRGQIDVSFEVFLTPEALTEKPIESYLINTVWAYFRQQVIGLFAGWQGSENLDLPIESPISVPINVEQLMQKNNIETHENADNLRPWEQLWDSKLSDNFRVSLLVTRIISDIHERKNEWYFSILELYAYLCIIETEKDFINTNVTIEKLDSEIIHTFSHIFGFNSEDWLKVEENARVHLIGITEEVLYNAFLSIIKADADPETSIIPDKFMQNIEDSLIENPKAVPEAFESAPETYLELTETLEVLSNLYEELIKNLVNDSSRSFDTPFSEAKIKTPVFARNSLFFGIETIISVFVSHNEDFSGNISLKFQNIENPSESLIFIIDDLKFVELQNL